jgi:hypothetical protein
MFKSGTAIVRSYLMFKPYVILGWIAAVLGVVGVIPLVRFFVFWLMGESAGHIQSLVIASSMTVGSLLALAILVIADLQRTNRVLLEDSLERIKRIQYESSGGSFQALLTTTTDAPRHRASAEDDESSGATDREG